MRITKVCARQGLQCSLLEFIKDIGGSAMKLSPLADSWFHKQFWVPMMALALWMSLSCSVSAADFDVAAGDVNGLIAAINAANDEGANPGPDTIILEAATYTLVAVNNATDGKNGLPSITSNISINGAGADNSIIKRDTNAPIFRIIHVAASGTLKLNGLTVSGGLTDGNDGGGIFSAGVLSLVNSAVHDNMIESIDYELVGHGGGIFSSGALTLTNSTVHDNVLVSVGVALVGNGGGIFSSGTLTLTNSTVHDNAAGSDFFGDGGGIFSSGTLTLTNSDVHNNVAGLGAGIVTSGTATLNYCTIRGNSAVSFSTGGISSSGTLTMTNSTVSGNFGLDAAGGMWVSGTAILTNSTISGNSQGGVGGGGGILNDGMLTLIHCTVSDNESSSEGGGIADFFGGTVELTHTIVAGNRSGFGDDCSTLITSLGHNLVGVGTGCTSDGPGDLTVDPADVFVSVLGPLQDNGGPTKTHALLVGSPAIDAGGPDCPPPAIDQRGFTRPVNSTNDGPGPCDIGAFEFGASYPLLNDMLAMVNVETSFDPTQLEDVCPGGVFTISATFTNTSTDQLFDLRFQVATLTGANTILNADDAPPSGDEGATISVSPASLGDNGLLDPGETVTQDFDVCLASPQPFQFFVDVSGLILHQ